MIVSEHRINNFTGIKYNLNQTFAVHEIPECKLLLVTACYTF